MLTTWAPYYAPSSPGNHPEAPTQRQQGRDQRENSQIPEIEPRLLVVDIVKRYRVSEWTVWHWLKAGTLRGHHDGGRWTTTWDAVFAFEGRLAPPEGEARERAKAPLLTVDDLAEYFRCRPETIRRRLRRGELAGRRIRGNWYADREAVAAYENANLTAPL